MRVVAVVLARLDSTRLPGKALRTVSGRPLVDYVVSAVRAADAVDDVVLATTDRPVDDELVRWAEANAVQVHRGSASNVAERFLGALEGSGADAGIRVNGDSPLHRPGLLSSGCEVWRAGRADLVTNVAGLTWPAGLSIEVVSRPAMRTAVAEISSEEDREHVTRYFYEHPSDFTIEVLPPGPVGARAVHLAVDDEEGFQRFTRMESALGDGLLEADVDRLIELAAAHGSAVDG
jgi:spore coat polysaccharide biosynthesis protein SpsF